MTDFTYNQTIEYIDGMRDLNFEAARKWAQENGTTFKEDTTARVNVDGVLKRYFIIGPEPELPEQTSEEKAAITRATRNRLLANCDWTQLADAPLTEEQKAAYAEYRQALRDVPEQDGFPDNVVWPTLDTAVEVE